MGSNLPPGVTEGMIPGNRPIDLETEKLYDEIDGLIRTFVDGSGVVAMYDVPEILSDLIGEIEREIKADWEAQKKKCKVPPIAGDEASFVGVKRSRGHTEFWRINRCRHCGEIPQDCECDRGGTRYVPNTDG